MYSRMNRESDDDGRMPELNAAVIARIRNLVSYEVPTDQIVEIVEESRTVTSRWVAFIANSIREGRF